MRIAINALSAVAGGGVTYLNQLFKYLSEIDRNNDYLIITTKKGKGVLVASYKNFQVLSFKFPSISPVFRIFWEQFYLWYILKKNRVAILYAPANIGLIFSSIPTVLMIQTVAPFYPEMIRNQNVYYRLKFNLLRLLTTFSIRKAKKIIFISERARKEVSLQYDLKEEDTLLIYHGRSLHFRPSLDEDRLQEIKRKYNLDQFILYVSNIYRYKNFLELVQAFSIIKDKIPSNIKLALVGKSFDDQYTKLLKTFVQEKGMNDRIIFFGHVSYEELPYFYALCKLFVYPSTCENCPNILIEAMACGTSILASYMEPMPEVCRDAAIYFDPFNPQDIAEKIQTLLLDKDALEKLKQHSLHRARCFDWEDTARKTLQAFEECI